MRPNVISTEPDLKFLIMLRVFHSNGVLICYRDLKQMNTRQAKISVETMKEVQNDKNLKTKGDKDRRLREKKQNNTKKFMEERKTLQVVSFCNIIDKFAVLRILYLVY